MIVIAIGRSRVRTQPYPLPSKIHNAFGPFAALTRTPDFVGIPKASTRISVALKCTWPLAAIASQASDVFPKGVWSLELALSQAPSTLPGSCKWSRYRDGGASKGALRRTGPRRTSQRRRKAQMQWLPRFAEVLVREQRAREAVKVELQRA